MKIEAKKREVIGKKVKNIRSTGLVPAAVYGPKKASANIQVDKKDFIKIFKEAGFNKFVDLVIEEEKASRVLIKDVQVHPISFEIKSISFYQIDEDRRITVEIPVTFVGESPAVKQNLGFLIHQLDTIAVHCLPKDLPSNLKVDVSTLEKPGDAITVGQLFLGEGVELDSGMDKTTAITYIGTAQKEEVVVASTTESTTVAGATPAVGTTPATAEKKEVKK